MKLWKDIFGKFQAKKFLSTYRSKVPPLTFPLCSQSFLVVLRQQLPTKWLSGEMDRCVFL